MRPISPAITSAEYIGVMFPILHLWVAGVTLTFHHSDAPGCTENLPVAAAREYTRSVLVGIAGPLNVLAVVPPVSGAAESFGTHLTQVDSSHLNAVLCLEINIFLRYVW